MNKYIPVIILPVVIILIILMRKSNIALVVLILLLSLAVISLNLNNDDAVATNNGFGSGRTVILDPGHGGEDPGAVSDFSGAREKEINLIIAGLVRQLLEADDYYVIMTRTEDVLEYTPGITNILMKRKEDLLRRKKIMDEAGADIVVSIHLNKFPQEQYYGAQTFFPGEDPKSSKLAAEIQKAVREKIDPANKREALLKKEPIIILKNHKTTTAIIECGFLSNPEEEKKLISPEYQARLAEAIKTGIDNYFR